MGHHRNLQGHREAPFAPSTQAPGKGSNALKSPPLQSKRHAGARELMRTSAVKDDLAIARDLRFFVTRTVLFKPVRINTNSTENALTVVRMTLAAL